jgi:hypothetical protein
MDKKIKKRNRNWNRIDRQSVNIGVLPLKTKFNETIFTGDVKMLMLVLLMAFEYILTFLSIPDRRFSIIICLNMCFVILMIGGDV